MHRVERRCALGIGRVVGVDDRHRAHHVDVRCGAMEQQRTEEATQHCSTAAQPQHNLYSDTSKVGAKTQP